VAAEIDDIIATDAWKTFEHSRPTAS